MLVEGGGLLPSSFPMGAGSNSNRTTWLPIRLQLAGYLHPPHPVTSRLLELYHECVDNGGQARVQYDARDGLEKLTIIRIIQPASTITAPSEKRNPGRQASTRRRELDRRRREAWAERRLHRLQPSLHTPPRAEEDSAMAELATTGQADTLTTSLLLPTVLTKSPQPATPSWLPSQSPHPSPSPLSQPQLQPRHCQHYRRSRNHRCENRRSQEKANPATWRMLLAAGPQLTPSPLASPLAEELSSPPLEPPDGTPTQPPEISPALLAQEEPTLPQALSPLRAPATPADNPVPPAEPSSSTLGYTLVMIWCPSCNNSLIDNHDIECYTC